MKKNLIIFTMSTFLFSNYIDVQVASFSYTIGGVYGSCVKFKKNQYDSFSDFNVCSCPSAANNSTYPNCYELYYNPQTKTVKYNYSEGGQYNYWTASNDYTCHNYTEETQILECSEMNQLGCVNDNSCEWIENIDSGWCASYNNNSSVCNSIDDCNWTTCQEPCTGGAPSDCTQEGCSYSWLEYTCTGYYSTPCCSGGSYQEDNSYCEEVEELECSEMDQLQCNQEAECEWLENIIYGDCSDYNNGNTCDANENCFWDLCYGGSYGSWSHCCSGGSYQVDNSYCTEINYMLGDVNGDGVLNVGDIVLIVGLILNSGYDNYADMNQDGILNVIDVIDLINTILSK